MDPGAVTYDEVRMWARWLQNFTAWDLADSMGVPLELGERSLKALVWHGIVEPLEDVMLDGPEGELQVFGYVPLPDGPREHWTGTPPEIVMGYTEVLTPRGLPIRIRTERQMRRSLSTPGARQVHKMRELAYQRQQEATRLRAEAQKNKAPKQAKWEKDKAKAKKLAAKQSVAA